MELVNSPHLSCKMDLAEATAIVRGIRIQEALDLRRSGSSISRSSNKSLSEEEEDELEGKAGDSGSARMPEDSETLREAEYLSGEFSVGSQGALGSDSLEAGTKAPHASYVVPISRVPSPPRIARSSQARDDKLHSSFEFVSILSYLTTFGIIGVIVRYLLELLFGPGLTKVTSNNNALFIDLPANMLGSFFMGWVGVVLKKDIARFSEHLAIGLSTGLMGSITTYAAMMQRMLALMVSGKWVSGFFGLLIGLQVAQMSLLVGVDSAKLLLRILGHINHNRGRKGLKKWERPSPDNLYRRRVSLLLFAFFGGALWFVAGVLTVIDDESATSRRTLWLACLVAPPGVWTRWYFARLNGQGLGAKHYLRWLPVGTLLVNVTASSLEAGLSCVQIAVGKYTTTLLVGGIQLGMLGCMSTVSTFVAEIQIMHQGMNRWRSYVYPALTMVMSLVVGILVYGVPIWVKQF